MDAVQKTGNGHPGTAMSLAPLAYTLFQRVMRHDPADPGWLGRDRFVLSAGHSSLTLYIQLYLSGYGLELDDLKALRTWGSLTPGHPEHGHTAGVETTTGPLGQGVGNAVGMAMAARRERGLLDPDAAPGESVFDHRIYAICSDGDIEEGVSGEASSLAGHQKLGNLTVIYDDNQISIEDDTNIALSEDVGLRYEAYGWHVQTVDWRRPDGTYVEDVAALEAALEAAEAETERPSFIRLRTIIAWPAPNEQNTGKAHGSALGADEVAATKKVLGFDPEKTLRRRRGAARARPPGAYARGQAAHADWQQRVRRLGRGQPGAHGSCSTGCSSPDPAGRLDRRAAELRGRPEGDGHPQGVRRGARRDRAGAARAVGRLGRPRRVQQHDDRRASRRSSRPSTRPRSSPAARTAGCCTSASASTAMGSILNGITLHGLTRVYGGTFLVFSDYMRPAVRLAALMKLPVTYVWTHDSIGLGEDGPTHQPIEHLAALRAIPGLDVVRPGDANETVVAWRTILEHTDRPAGALPDPAERADLRPLARLAGRHHRRGGRHRPRCVRAGRGRGEADPGGDPHRHRLGGLARGGGPEAAGGRRRCHPGGVHAVPGVVLRSRTTPTGTRCCRPGVKARVSVEAGGRDGLAGPGRRRRRVREHRALRRERAVHRRCSSSSASRRTGWWPRRTPAAVAGRPDHGLHHRQLNLSDRSRRGGLNSDD